MDKLLNTFSKLSDSEKQRIWDEDKISKDLLMPEVNKILFKKATTQGGKIMSDFFGGEKKKKDLSMWNKWVKDYDNRRKYRNCEDKVVEVCKYEKGYMKKVAADYRKFYKNFKEVLPDDYELTINKKSDKKPKKSDLEVVKFLGDMIKSNETMKTKTKKNKKEFDKVVKQKENLKKPKKSTKKNNKNGNAWIDHVKKVQNNLGITYSEALKEAKKTYKKSGKGKIGGKTRNLNTYKEFIKMAKEISG